MTDETWIPGVAAGAVTDYWEARFEDAFAAGLRRGYELVGRDDLVAEHDAFEENVKSTWCQQCIERRWGSVA
jgi:hypothetical protein